MRTQLVMVGVLFFVGCTAETVADAGPQTGGGAGGGGGVTVTGGGTATGGGEALDAGTAELDAGTDAGTGEIDAGIEDAGTVIPEDGLSCATAWPLGFGNREGDSFEHAGDRRYWRFTLTQSQWVSLASPDDHVALGHTLDPAMTVLTADGVTLIAANDDSSLMGGLGSRIDFHPSAGTYCVRLEDSLSWLGLTPVDHPNATLELSLTSPDGSFYIPATIEEEPNDAASTATDVEMARDADNFQHGSLLGILSSDTDVDVFHLLLPSNGALEFMLQTVLTQLHAPSGPGRNGLGSGLDRVAVKITALDGTVFGEWHTTQASVATTPATLLTRVTAGDEVLIWITRPAGSTLTSNDSYQMSLSYISQLPRETNDAANNDPLTAQVLPLTNNTASVSGTISAGDVDHYALNLNANDTVMVECKAFRMGSGLHGVWELLSPTLVSLQAETESDVLNTWWNASPRASLAPVIVPTTGRYVFKVSGAAQEPGNPSNGYRCYVDVAP